jgi:hypothetical protein
MSGLLRMTCIGLMLCCMASAAEGPRRYRFCGKMGDKVVDLDLTLVGQDATGWYTYDGLDRPFVLEGKCNDRGRVSLRESEADGHVTASLRGRLNRDDERFFGSWRSDEEDEAVPFDLALVADYVTLESSPGPTSSIKIAYPHLILRSKFAQDVESLLAASAHETCASTIDNARKVSHPEVINWYLAKTDFDLKYLSDDLISVLVRHWANAGGVHGSTSFSSQTFWLRDGKATRIKLDDVFKPGSAWVKRVSDCAIEDLRRQNASDVQFGTVTAIKREWMDGANITASGISLTFEEYTVGCYAEGCFRVVVPWTRLSDLVDAAGPGGRFVRTESHGAN